MWRFGFPKYRFRIFWFFCFCAAVILRCSWTQAALSAKQTLSKCHGFVANQPFDYVLAAHECPATPLYRYYTFEESKRWNGGQSAVKLLTISSMFSKALFTSQFSLSITECSVIFCNYFIVRFCILCSGIVLMFNHNGLNFVIFGHLSYFFKVVRFSFTV